MRRVHPKGSTSSAPPPSPTHIYIGTPNRNSCKDEEKHPPCLLLCRHPQCGGVQCEASAPQVVSLVCLALLVQQGKLLCQAHHLCVCVCVCVSVRACRVTQQGSCSARRTTCVRACACVCDCVCVCMCVCCGSCTAGPAALQGAPPENHILTADVCLVCGSVPTPNVQPTKNSTHATPCMCCLSTHTPPGAQLEPKTTKSHGPAPCMRPWLSTHVLPAPPLAGLCLAPPGVHAAMPLHWYCAPVDS